MELGEKSPWEVVRCAKDLWRFKERIGRLQGTDGGGLESESDKVDGLVANLFGGDAAEVAGHTSGPVECPYDEGEVMGWVRDSLSGTKNNSAAGPDGIGYRLIKAVRDTRLRTAVLGEVVAAQRGGYIPDRWRDMWVVLILNLGWNLTQTRNWPPLNLINSVGKLREKVVADRIQEEGESVLHHQQFGSVRGHSTVDILYKSGMKRRKCL